MEINEQIQRLEAAGEFVFVIEDEVEQDLGNYIRPENSSTKPNTGYIISAGPKVEDKNVRKGRTAIFNAAAGQVINIFDTDVKVLSYGQVLGVVGK